MSLWPENSKPFIVIGMHRSGTSFFSRCLTASGVMMGEDLSGNHESEFFSRINRELLKAHGGSWAEPVRVGSNPEFKLDSWTFVKRYYELRLNPKHVVRPLLRKPWGWKDPRNTFTLQFWLEKFPQARVIHIYRHYADVMASLRVRNTVNAQNASKKGFVEAVSDEQFNYNLWQAYVTEARGCKAYANSFLEICYEKLLQGDQAELQKVDDYTRTGISSKIKEMADPDRAFKAIRSGKENPVKVDEQFVQSLGYPVD